MDILKNEDGKKARNTAFGLRLKMFRQGVSLTQEQLAERVGKSTETISKMERGLIYPGVDMLILLAEQVGTSLDSLVGINLVGGLSNRSIALVSEASSILSQMDEKTLNVAVLQLRALVSLNE
jgi:transcriptional regulator with XRE-family HTH domain